MNGLRQRINRLLESKSQESRLEGGVLRNFLKVVDAAQELGKPESLLSMDDHEFASCWTVIKDEVQAVPLSWAGELLRRHSSRLFRAREWSQLVRALNPWVEDECGFNPLRPSFQKSPNPPEK